MRRNRDEGNGVNSPRIEQRLAALCLALVFCVWSTLWGQAPQSSVETQSPAEGAEERASSPTCGNPGDSAEDATPDPAVADESSGTSESTSPEERTSLNLLGEVDTSSGEARRNENVRITLIDNNVLKEINVRMGTTATITNEFRVDRGYFGKEFGGAPDGPPHLSQSDVAGFHGKLFWSHNNSVLTARSFFQVGDVQPARDNDYGVSAGVPLWEGAALTIDASQRKVRGQVNGNVLVPTLAERIPLASDPATRAIIESIFNAFPSQAPNRTDIDPRALNTNSPQSINNNRASALLDQTLGARDRLSLRYSATLQNVEAFQLVGGQNPDTTTKNHSARMTWNRVWTPSTVTDFSGGFDRIGSLLVSEETSLGPLFLFGRQLQSIGPTSAVPIDRVQNMFRYAGRVRHVRGRHMLHAGYDLLRRQVNGIESADQRGTFSFRSDFGRDTITNLQMGTPSTFWFASGNVHRGFRNWDMQYYIGDDWRVSRDLTLNLGLRYEPVTSPADVNDLSTIPYDCDCNNLAPTFGFALRLSDRWGVLRGAYGVHYGEIFPVTFGQARFNPPGSVRVSRPAPSLANPLQDFADSAFDPTARSAPFFLDSELSSPYSHQYNFSWEITPVREWTLSLGYVGSRSHRLLTTWFLNRARQVEGVEQTTDTIDERRPDPRFFEMRRILNGSRGYFDAAKLTLTVPRWAGMSIDASYWFSKAIDLGSDYSNTASGRDARNARSPSEFNYHGEMRGLSNFDQTHALLARFNYETPRLRTQRGWVQRIFSGWQLSSALLLKSGTPFAVQAGSDGPGVGNVDGTSSDRPSVLDPSVLGRVIDDPDTSAAMLPRAAFGFNQPGELTGNLGRNTFRKDGIWNINAGLSRRWALGADRSVLFRAESLNSLNHPQFAEPGAELNSPNFGRITNTLNDGRTFRFTLEFAF